MRQLIVLSFSVELEGEKNSINEIKEMVKEHISDSLKEKKSKVNEEDINYLVFDQEKYLNYSSKMKKHMLDGFKTSHNYGTSVDSDYHGSKVDLTIVNRSFTENIPEINYVNGSGKDANVFVSFVASSKAEEKIMRSINSQATNYSKYLYE